MVFFSSMKPKSLLPWLSLATTILASSGTIQDVEHGELLLMNLYFITHNLSVVLFMQENRAFDHVYLFFFQYSCTS